MAKPPCSVMASISLALLISGCGQSAVPAPLAASTGPGSSTVSSNGSFPSLPAGALTAAFAPGVGCARGIVASPAWKHKTREEILAWLATYGVSAIQPNLTQEYLAEFAAEFERIPDVFRKRVFLAGGTTHLLQGRGVTEDPSWSPNVLNTFDGRSWSTVPGSGGAPYMSLQGGDSPTRFVINRLYEGHGSVNLVIHEFAHALDAITRGDGFSGRPAWVALTQSDAQFRAAIGGLCNTYCTEHTEESFAESFAVFHSCDSTRTWFEQKAPAAARWISLLASQL